MDSWRLPISRAARSDSWLIVGGAFQQGVLPVHERRTHEFAGDMIIVQNIRLCRLIKSNYRLIYAMALFHWKGELGLIIITHIVW